MQPKKPRSGSHTSAMDSTKAVNEFMRVLEHPFKSEIEAIRAVILGVDPAIAEGIKWNAPSYRTSEYFATTNLRERKGIGIILHLGAKVRDLPAGSVTIDDPTALLKWLAKDRALIAFESAEDLEGKKDGLSRIVRQWIVHV